MGLVNRIESAIKELEGGRFQKLGDAYLRRKYQFSNLVSLGSQEGTDKTTRGIPDSYAEKDGKYIYIMYGTHTSVVPKLKEDIQAVKKKILDEGIEQNKIDRIICCHTSSNISIKQREELEVLAKPYQLELIGINEVANDLTRLEFQFLAKEYLSINEFTEQVWSIDDFIKIHDSSTTNAPISNFYIGEVNEGIKLLASSENRILLISSKPGTGKTRLAIEICSILAKKGLNVLCVKSNNQSIYQDIKYHLDSQKDNIIFIDDVNTVQNYISTLGLLSTNNNVRFILTVRDYAKNEVVNNIKNYGYSSLEPTILQDDNFKQLLQQFSKHEFTQQQIEHIENISKGNPRIAVLAVLVSNSQDLTKFKNEIDILQDYYEGILLKNNISFEEQKALFILSYLKKISFDSLKDNQEFIKLLQLTNISEKLFKDGVERLHNRELCNIYNSKIVKIADQSLDDYIVIKFLINKKISVLDILHALYPLNNQKVIQLLNQFSNFVHNENDFNIISEAAKEYYAENIFQNVEEKEGFLAQFGILLPLEAISYVKDTISDIVEENYTQANFVKEKNKGKTVDDSLLLIIQTVIKTKYYKHGLQLLMNYFVKKPNLISEVYDMLEKNCGLITERDYIDYNIAKATLAQFKQLDLDKIYNQELIVTILKQYWKIEVERATAKDEKTFTFGHYTIPDSGNLVQYHAIIVEILEKLYSTGTSKIRYYIEKILYDYQFTILNYSNTHQKTIEQDLKNIKYRFFSNLSNLSLSGEKIVFTLHEAEIKSDFEVFSEYKASERQKIYNNLANSNYAWRYKDDEQADFNQIVISYSSNWEKIFTYAYQFKQNTFMNNKNIERVLYNMYQKLADKKVDFLRAMFKTGYHLEIFTPNDLLEGLHQKEIHTIIQLSPDSEKYKWQFAYLTKLKKIKEEDIQLLEILLEDNLIPEYLNILHFEQFLLSKPDLKEILIQKAKSIQFTIPFFVRDEEVARLINLMGKYNLKRLYLRELGSNIDQSGDLFQVLGYDDIDFTVNILKRINDLRLNYNNVHMILHKIKSFKNVEKVYLSFLYYILENSSLYYYNSLLESIIKENHSILFDAIELSDSEELIIKMVNLGVEVFKEKNEKLKLFEIIKSKGYGKTTFSKIHYSAMSDTFSGSYVPVLEQKQIFLQSVKEIFENDLEYIDLVMHIDKIITNCYQQMEKELEKEF